MDCEKVFDAIEHLRRMVDWCNPLIDPNSPAMAEAEKYIEIIRQNGPPGAPCEARLISLSSWLRILFCEPKETKGNAIRDLDDIEALALSSLVRQTA